VNTKFYAEVRDYGRRLFLAPVEVKDGRERMLRLMVDESPVGDGLMTGNEDYHFIFTPAEARDLYDLLGRHISLMVKE